MPWVTRAEKQVKVPRLTLCHRPLGCSGICREGDQLVVGPTDDGCFLELRVCSIQRNRSACRVLRAGQAATLALGDFDRALLRKVRWEGGLETKQKEKCLGDCLLE